MTHVLPYLQLLLPITPQDTGDWPPSALMVPVRQALQTSLSYLGLSATAAVERALALCIIRDQIVGLTFPVGAGQVPLLLAVVRHFVERPEAEHVPLMFRVTLLDSIASACQQLQQQPYNVHPTYDESPLLACIADLAQSNLFPRGLEHTLWNLLDLLRSNKQQPAGGNLRKLIYDLTWATRHFSRKVGGDDIASLASYPNADEIVRLLWAALDKDKPTNKRTYSTYRRDIERLAQMPGDAAMGGSRHGRRSTIEYDLLGEDDPIRQAFAVLAAEAQAEIDDGLMPFTETDLSQERRRSETVSRQSTIHTGSGHHYRFDWPQTIQRNLTRHTPGVLKAAELGAIFRGLADDTRWLSATRRDRAALVLLAGCFCGWTKQLPLAQIVANIPSPNQHPGLVWLPDGVVSIRPHVPLGWPDLLQPVNAGTDSYERFIKDHFLNYETVSPAYQLPLHPAIAPVAQRLVRQSVSAVFMAADDYQLALQDLTTQLQLEFPNAAAITGGRLMASFRGWAHSLGLDGADSFVVSGRAMSQHEMPINYTLISISEACRHHWHFVNQWLDDIRNECAASNWQTGDFLTPASECQVNTLIGPSLYTGSCFVMQFERLTRLFRFVAEQSSRTDLPAYEQFNWRMRRVGLEAGLLLLMRPFEFDAMPLPPDYQLGGPSFAYVAKTKPDDERTVAHKYLSSCLRDRWWAMVAQCAAGYTSGPVWCLRGSSGERLHFNLQDELNYVLALLDAPEIVTRSYSLRHTGRTLHRRFGMREAYLNYKMNHDTVGTELFNPARPDSYRALRLEDDIVVERILGYLGSFN